MQKPLGLIRLPATPVPDLRSACAFSEDIGGPRFSVTVRLDGSGLQPGAAAGLVLYRTRYLGLSLERGEGGATLVQFDEERGTDARVPLVQPCVHLRAECDFVDGTARFSYSLDGHRFAGVGEAFSLTDGRGASRGVRCSLFSYSPGAGSDGGCADFDAFVVAWS